MLKWLLDSIRRSDTQVDWKNKFYGKLIKEEYLKLERCNREHKENMQKQTWNQNLKFGWKGDRMVFTGLIVFSSFRPKCNTFPRMSHLSIWAGNADRCNKVEKKEEKSKKAKSRRLKSTQRKYSENGKSWFGEMRFLEMSADVSVSSKTFSNYNNYSLLRRRSNYF